MKIGYAYVPRDGVSEKVASRELYDLGADKVFVDVKSREWRDNPMFFKDAVRKGDHFILLSAEGFLDEEFDIDGKPKSYRRMRGAIRAMLKPVAALGVTVSIRDGKAMTYSDNETIDHFIDVAVEERHKRLSSSGGSGAKRKPGRPVKYFATDDQKKAICLMWWDKAIERGSVRANATEMVGWKVTDNVIKSWCGNVREKPDG